LLNFGKVLPRFLYHKIQILYHKTPPGSVQNLEFLFLLFFDIKNLCEISKNIANLPDFTPGKKNSQFFGGQKNVKK
jgi:hypothetical protein